MSAAAKSEISTLTVLRGVAAILIVVHHFTLISMQMRASEWAPALQKCALLAMSIFFVLSGFVIHYNYGQKISAEPFGVARFVVARFARLMPLYFVFVLANFAYNWFFPDNGNRMSYLAALPINLLALQSWWYGTVAGLPLQSSQVYANVAWSISTEVLLYLLFVPIALGLRFDRALLRRGVIIVAAGMIGRLLIVKLADTHAFSAWLGGAGPDDASNWLIYHSPYGRFFEFLSGVGLSEIWLATRESKTRLHPIAIVLGSIGFAYVVLSMFDRIYFEMPRLFGGDRIYTGYGIAVPLLIYMICALEDWRLSILRAAPLVFIGEISYSIYFAHADLIPLARIGLQADSSWAMRAVLFAVAVLGIATASYYAIERPAKHQMLRLYALLFEGKKLTISRPKGAMTRPMPSIIDRILGRAKPDRKCYEQGVKAGANYEGGDSNPYQKGTLEHWSWKIGYKRGDDWDYVW